MTLDILCFGAHPDDVELTISGTIIKMVRKGYKVGIIDLTKGEKSSRGTPEQRDEEVKQASKIMGIQMRECLEIPDTQVTNNLENRTKVVKVLRRFRPRVVILPPNDERHPDHRNAEDLVREACYFSGLKNLEANDEPYRPFKVLQVHRLTSFSRPSFICDISDCFDAKLEAIKAYKTQFPPGEKTRAGLFVIGEVIEFVTARSRYYGSLIGTKYGEGFVQAEVFEVDDLMKLTVPSM